MLVLSVLSVLLCGATAHPLHHARGNSNVPFGSPSIQRCTKSNTVALTFDDGPFTHTERLLDMLKEANIKATFFMNGANWSNIRERAATVKRVIAEGHQIGSHLWNHPNVTLLTGPQLTWQMTKLEDAMLEIIGRYPHYMRAPNYEHDARTRGILGKLGYHVIDVSLNTYDWAFKNTGDTTAADEFTQNVNDGTIALMHDVHNNTVEVVVPRVIKTIKEQGFDAVTVGECLEDPKGYWYGTDIRYHGDPPEAMIPPEMAIARKR